MVKKMGEILKIIIASILSMFMTVVVLSGTVISNKADTEYVDKKDEEIKTEFRKADDDIKEGIGKDIEEIKAMQTEQRIDIKEILKKL